jgi:ABC-type Na+ transport system ATPase subunit NatA
VVNIDQQPIGRNSRSNPATYIGFYDNIRDLFTEAPLSVERGYKAGRFSFNVKGGRCEECQGEGVIRTQLYFMPDVEVTCGACKGARFNAETLEVTVRGKTIDDVLNMSIEEGVTFFASEPVIGKRIEVLNDLGLGYLTLGQSATTLSGGEAQRIKIASEMSKLQRAKHTVYILDEPTTGLHLADVERLLMSLNKLVNAGHTVILIEHHLDVIKTADHVIDLGPEGGHAGGEVVVTGTPEDVAKCKASHTGRFLKAHLGSGHPRRESAVAYVTRRMGVVHWALQFGYAESAKLRHAFSWPTHPLSQDNATPIRWLTRFNQGNDGGRPRGGRMRHTADGFGSGRHGPLPIDGNCRRRLDAGAGFHSPRRLHRSGYRVPGRREGRIRALRSGRPVREQRCRRRHGLVNRTCDGDGCR